MSITEHHRFLYGKTPQTADRRIWVLSGPDDWYYHNLLHGCVDVQRTIELWAVENGMDLIVSLDRNGVLGFQGNPDPIAAKDIFERVSGSGRRPPYGQRRRPSQQSETERQTSNTDDTAATASQRAEQARAAAGGVAQADLNTFTKLANLLQQKEVRSLIIVTALSKFLMLKEMDQQTVRVAREIEILLQYEWYKIDQGNLVVFIERDENTDTQRLMNIYPADAYKKVLFERLAKPSTGEVKAVLERMARRNNVRFSGMDAIAKTLTRHDNLCVALQNVLRVANTNNKGGIENVVTLEKILQLPPLNEDAILEVKKELNALVGLQDLKDKITTVEQKARDYRKKLEDGAAQLPDDAMHMVFYGGPGTGKTTAANIVAKFFHAVGLLRRDNVRDLTASTVMSSFVNETRQNMQRTLEENRGGVLFIDEAHQFGNKESSGAKEAIEALVPMSWNYRHEMVIILAGYENRMPDFFSMDEGLERRFPGHLRIQFPDYSATELWEIFQRDIRKKGFTMDERAVQRIQAILRRRMRRKSFGNAGGVGILVNEILQTHAASERRESTLITEDDLPPLVRRNEQAFREANDLLNNMLGLGPMKQQLDVIINSLEYDIEEEERGSGSGDIRVHPGNMIFVGPPGTGKTTMGRDIIPKLLFGMGCIELQKGISVSRENLVGKYVGHSAANVLACMEKARDGVLFLDEAYSLCTDERDSFGKEAVTTLVRQTTESENAGTIFILGGYENKIDEFLATNEGLERRFPIRLKFPNFSPDDCMELARRLLVDQNYTWEDGVLDLIRNTADMEIQRMGNQFGNAGWVQGLINQALKRMKTRINKNRQNIASEDRRKLVRADFPVPEEVSPGASPASVLTRQDRHAFMVTDWQPQEHAVTLPLAGAVPAPLSPGEINDRLSECAFQLITQGQDGKQYGGTGFFVTPDGLMVTSEHVVADTKEVLALCGPDRQPCPTRILATDPNVDLAVISVETITPTPFLLLGDSLHTPPLTELIAFGNAHVSPGEAGRFIRVNVSRNELSDPRFIETDGDIEKGFSGGPVLSADQGAVIAVVEGGYGPSAKILVRAEQVRELLRKLGYAFEVCRLDPL